MVRKIISSILIVIILALWMPIQPISDWVQECMSVQAIVNNNITTIDLTGITSGGEANHTHIYEGKYDNTSHWEECWICNKKVNVQTHHLVTSGIAGCKSALGYQRQYCTDGCGYSKQLPKVAHTWGQYRPDAQSNLHFRECQVCGDWGETQRCISSSGERLGCGRAGTCRICGVYYNGSHLHLVDGYCAGCGTKFYNYNITNEVINEKTTRLRWTFTPINGLAFDVNNVRLHIPLNNQDQWTYQLENCYKSGNTYYATALVTANNSATTASTSVALYFREYTYNGQKRNWWYSNI